MRRVINMSLATIAIVILLIPKSGMAQEKRSGKKWEFLIRPVFYAPNVSGDIVLNEDTATVQSKITRAGILGFETHNDKWAILSDLSINSFSTDVTTHITARTGDFDATIIVLGVYSTYKVAKWVELGLGGRLIIVGSNLYLEQSLLFDEVNNEFDLYLFPPLLIYRFNFVDTPKWEVKLFGDVGGFGFYETFTYLINPYVRYWISKRIGAEVAYRLLLFDHEDPKGIDAMKLTFSGAQAGISFRF